MFCIIKTEEEKQQQQQQQKRMLSKKNAQFLGCTPDQANVHSWRNVQEERQQKNYQNKEEHVVDLRVKLINDLKSSCERVLQFNMSSSSWYVAGMWCPLCCYTLHFSST